MGSLRQVQPWGSFEGTIVNGLIGNRGLCLSSVSHWLFINPAALSSATEEPKAGAWLRQRGLGSVGAGSTYRLSFWSTWARPSLASFHSRTSRSSVVALISLCGAGAIQHGWEHG